MVASVWIDEFATIMSGETITHSQIAQAMALKDEHLPDKIYKFREVSDYSLSNFRHDTVWLCSTDKYNDPFECSAKIGFERLLAAPNSKATEIMLASMKPHLSDEELSTLLSADDPMRAATIAMLDKDASITPEEREIFAGTLFAAVEEIQSETVSGFNAQMQKGMKVCSFGSRNDSVLMWGHYAKSHSGFCLEYDVRSWPSGDKRRRILHPVIYSSEVFDSTKYIVKAMAGGMFNNLFGVMAAIRKAKEWSYEEEWRFVLPLGESVADTNYPMPTPSALYIGAKIAPTHRTQLTAIAATKGIPAYQMRLSTAEFKMTFDPIPTPVG
jgi:hypothetical protein